LGVNIAILGTGSVGSTLGVRWAKAGHHVTFGSRDPRHEKVAALTDRCGHLSRACSLKESIADAEVVLLAIPWPAAQATLADLGDLGGRVLIDATNPLKADMSGIELGHHTSAAEQIAAWAPTARVVKAFNSASVRVMNDPLFGNYQATMFFCGDDAEAKKLVHDLIAALQFDPVDAGPLSSARYLEPLAMLYIHLAFKQGWGSNCAFKILKR
jgi:NADPH-dependent F420 reductase